MSVLNVVSFLVVLLLGVSSEDSVKNGQSSESQITSLPKPSKLSEFFIGDLLRTENKEHLETSSSVNNPVTTTEQVAKDRMDSYPSSGRLITKFNIHGGHDSSVEEPLTRTRDDGPFKRMERVPLNVVEKYTIRQAGVLERNVMSSEGDFPTGRYARAREPPRYKGDCKKNKHSSSEEVYSDDESPPYASHSSDYRSTPSSYHPEHEPYVSSHGSSSSQPSQSKSLASNSQSQSGKSYSSSKSTSNVAGRPKKVHVFEVKPAHPGSYQQGHNKPTHSGSYHQGHGSSGDVVVHKVRDTSESEEDYYSDERPIRGSNSYSNAEPVTQHYVDYPPQAQKQGYQRPKSQFHAIHNQEQEYNSRPAPYRNNHYENPRSLPTKQNRYNTPAELHSQGHTQNTRTPEQHAIYRDDAHASGPLTQNLKDGRQHYPSTGNGHRYQQEPQLQPSRPRNGIPQPSRNTHVSETGHVNTAYEKNRQIIRPSEATTQEYAYNPTPYSNKGEIRNPNPRGTITTRDIRSSLPSHPAIQSRTENPHILVTKSSDPSVSRSVSYSESSYNMNQPTRSAPRAFPIEQQPRIFEDPQKMTNPLHLKGNHQGRGYQTPNRPYNSEYPASYGDDQVHYNGGGNSEEHSYEDPHHEPQQQYDGPHHPYDSSEQEQGYGPQSPPKPESDITGYKEEYTESKPLELDDAFFERYGISKKAKVIYATAMQPNLFVADGTNIKDPDQNEGPSEEYRESRQNTKEERYEEEPQQFSPSMKIPGSFSELVDSNPKFLRQYSATSKRARAEVFPNQHTTLDDLVFQSGLGDPKAFVRSQGPRELVQKHGNGMSRIIFNKPLDLSIAEGSEIQDSLETKGESRVVKVLQNPEQKLSVEAVEGKKQH